MLAQDYLTWSRQMTGLLQGHRAEWSAKWRTLCEGLDPLAPADENRLAAIAVERGCGRLEWWCLDWNKPSIDFYLGMGARPMSDWTVYRIDGERLEAMAADARR